jgi:hypothetical protein
MCLVKEPYLRDYWSTDPVIQTTYAKSTGMLRDRLMAILTMFQLNDNENRTARGQPCYDPLFKIHPRLKNLNKKFQTVYWPDEFLTIDKDI